MGLDSRLLVSGETKSPLGSKFFFHPGNSAVYQIEAVLSSFFLAILTEFTRPIRLWTYFMSARNRNGAIRWAYDIETGNPVVGPENPEGLGLPLFAWAEFNLYHKSANKKG